MNKRARSKHKPYFFFVFFSFLMYILAFARLNITKKKKK